MPTRRALRDSGARLLELAIARRGGPDAVALELGFRARRGNHVNWDDLLRDVQQVVRAGVRSEAGSEWWIPSGPAVNPPRHMDGLHPVGLGLGGDGVQVEGPR